MTDDHELTPEELDAMASGLRASYEAKLAWEKRDREAQANEVHPYFTPEQAEALARAARERLAYSQPDLDAKYEENLVAAWRVLLMEIEAQKMRERLAQ